MKNQLRLVEKNGFKPADDFNADKIYAQMQIIDGAMTSLDIACPYENGKDAL